MHVVVAGGAGFIGSHLCRRLLADGHEVACLDNLSTGRRVNIAELEANPAFRFVEHDVTEPMPFEADAVFHLASPASPPGYLRRPVETLRVNSEGTRHLLEQAHRNGARFLLASTSEVYGDPDIHPQHEGYWGNVNSVGVRACYDEGKRFAEAITTTYLRTYDLDARIVRIFNTYGPRSDPDDGRLAPNFITQALRGAPLTLYGGGEQTRSLCYVSDLVDGLVRAMFADAARGEVINLGNPEEHTVREYAERIRVLCGSASPIVHVAAELGDDPRRRRPDIAKARRLLDWQPRTALDDGLRATIAYFSDELRREAGVLTA
ncbi:MAG: UDP-glucuronic acid decarboxylase family protein [Dehalococcoidia bacterium]